MTTEVQLDRSGDWEDIDYSDFEINVATSERKLAPDASVTTQARESIGVNQDARIRIDGTTVFEGRTVSPGTKRANGQVDLDLRHAAYELFGEAVTFDETGPPTDQEVLNAALSASNTGGNFTLDYNGSTVTLDNDYSAENRPVKNVFRDMMDRTGKVWWVEPAGSTIHVEPTGFRGTWNTLDAETDGVGVRSFDAGSVESVRNVVTVTGTGEEATTATATDSTSINNYGRQVSDYNVEYAIAQSEAQALASSLLQPTPLASASVSVPQGVGDVTVPLVNYEIDLTDDAKDISATGLEIEAQTIEQGRAILEAGGGTAESIANANRRAKSAGDKTPAGTVINTDRLADDSVDREQLVDRAVDSQRIELSTIIADNLADSAVERAKIAQAAINEEKIETGTIGATRLFITDWIPIGLSLGDDDPNAGDISWNSHELVYEGDTYNISSGSTSDKYVYWLDGNTSYSTAPDGSKPDLGNDDAMVAINENGTARQILQATEIHGGAIRTGTIEAAEIKSGIITADLIDALNLATDELTVGNNDGTLEFENGVNNLILNPSGTVNLGGGSGGEFNFGDFGGLDARDLFVSNSASFTGGTTQIDIEEDPGGVDTAIFPTSANEGLVGTASDYFLEMNAGAFNTQSPARVESVDRDDIRESDWYDNPPKPVKDEQRRQAERRNDDPEGIEHADEPVELGTMAMWLMEVCRDQQQQIDELRERVETGR